jgi:inorganic pyrophosphatase
MDGEANCDSGSQRAPRPSCDAGVAGRLAGLGGLSHLAGRAERPHILVLTDFLRLPLRRSRSVFNVVVETPRGSPVKLEYDTKHKVFAYGHPLMLGLAYPYDWGFFPRTQAEDGDPLDALVLHESATYPGVVLACRLIGVVRLTEKQAGKSRIRNDRVICVPDAAANFSDARDVPRPLQKELERFFQATAALAKKSVRIDGWSGPKEALRMLKRTKKVS